MVYNTIFVGKVRIHLKKIDSTNHYATRLLKEEPPMEGTLISADHQFAGKGQRGNKWLTEAGENLTISIILYPKFLLAYQQFLLSQSIALAVQNFAKETLGEGVTVKWPNDVYYRQQKIGGILIENSLIGKYIASSVIGIGININQASFDSSIQNATSFHQITGQKYDLNLLIEKLAKHIENYYLQLKAGQHSFLQQKYLANLYQFKEWHLYENTSNNNIFRGKIVNVQADGKLVMEVNGKQQKFNLKEVKFLPPSNV